MQPNANVVAILVLGALLQGSASRTLRVSAKLDATADSFTLSYTVENLGDDDAYLMDISHVIHGRTAEVSLQPIYVAWLGKTHAHLVQGIAPLPPDRDVNVTVVPLASRIAPHKKITRTITLPRPLAEFGPYDAPATGTERRVDRLTITVVALRPSARGFAATAMQNHPDVFRVRSDYTIGHVERASTAIALPKGTWLRTFDNARLTRVR